MRLTLRKQTAAIVSATAAQGAAAGQHSANRCSQQLRRVLSAPALPTAFVRNFNSGGAYGGSYLLGTRSLWTAVKHNTSKMSDDRTMLEDHPETYDQLEYPAQTETRRVPIPIPPSTACVSKPTTEPPTVTVPERCREAPKTNAKPCFHPGKSQPELDEELVFAVFTRMLQLYEPHEIMLSFNGGKDCTVVLHMLAKYYQQHTLQHVRIPVLYVQSEDAFEEIDEFVVQCTKNYNVELIRRCGSIKQVLTDVCKDLPQIKAVVMGTRRTDPHCAKLNELQATDPGWPKLMRINPILDWNCRDVWAYIFVYQVPYCNLYDQGYTSIGNKNNTLPNPHLEQYDHKTGTSTYRPAYELVDDDSLERAGRL